MPKRVDTASIVVPAPPSTVYAAFADASALERWMPPANMTATLLHFDFREGGSYRMRLAYEDPDDRRGKTTADADEVEVRLVKLVEAERIEQAITFESTDPAFAGVMRMTWTFEPSGQGTRVTVRAEDVPRGIRPEDHEAGMRSTLENLAAYLQEAGP